VGHLAHFIFIILIAVCLFSLLFVACAGCLQAGPKQFFQTYGFIAQRASEEEEEFATAKVAAAEEVATKADLEAAKKAAAASCWPAVSSNHLATVLIEAFALSLKGDRSYT
jgi:hypothetical protein